MSIATTALWVVGYLGNQSFPLMQKNLGSDGTFWVFSTAAFMNLVCVLWLVPETKGTERWKTLTRFWTTRTLSRRVIAE